MTGGRLHYYKETYVLQSTWQKADNHSDHEVWEDMWWHWGGNRKLGTGHPKTELDHPSIDLGKPKVAPFLRQGGTPVFLCGGYL